MNVYQPTVNAMQLQDKLHQALTLHRQGLSLPAQAMYQEILSIAPNHFDALHLLGVARAQSGQHQEAVNLISKAISINPNHPSSHCNLGNAFYKLNELDAAMQSYDQALRLKPDFADAYSNRGNALRDLGRLQEALINYNRAIELNPQLADAYTNLGNALKELGYLDSAEQNYRASIVINPNFHDAYWCLSLLLLLRGQFEEGWRLYEHRWKINDGGPEKRAFSQPLWLGDVSLQGKSILIHSEQGFGDSLQFCRYLPQVKALAGRVVLEVERSLMSTMASLHSADLIVPKGSPLPPCDYHCPLLSLPLAFKVSAVTDIPIAVPYLKASAELVSIWEARLGKKFKPRIGLVWSGSSTHKMDHHRSIALEELVNHLPPQFEYVSLQRDVRDRDLEVLRKHHEIRHFGEWLNDFSETTALCELVDLVVSVDTSLVHLAGAMGKPTWLLLPFSPDWRWLLGREDNPWYPTMRLFRIENGEAGWRPVLAKLTRALLEWHEQRGSIT